MNQVQTDLCRDYLAFKGDITLTLVDGTSEYTLANTIYKFVEIIEPSDWVNRLEIIHNTDRWANIVRDSTISSTQPLYASTWNKVFRLWPVPSAADQVSIFAYLLPTTDLLITADPEIPSEWDEALMLGTMAKLSGGIWEDKYVAEALKQSDQKIKESVAGVQTVQNSCEQLGF
jgi:hypothetical protein